MGGGKLILEILDVIKPEYVAVSDILHTFRVGPDGKIYFGTAMSSSKAASDRLSIEQQTYIQRAINDIHEYARSKYGKIMNPEDFE